MNKIYITLVISMFVTLLQPSTSFATQTATSPNLRSAGIIVDPDLVDIDTYTNDDFVSREVQQQLKKVNSTGDKSHFFRRDLKKYKPHIKYLTEMMQSLTKQHKQRCRGGQARVTSVVKNLNELVKIHKEEPYGSESKMKRLDSLLVRIKKEKRLLNNKRKSLVNDFAIYVPETAEEEVHQFFSRSRYKERIHCVGANLSAAIVFGGEAGLELGVSQDFTGSYSLVAALRGGIGAGANLTMTAGYHSTLVKRDNHTLWKGLHEDGRFPDSTTLGLGAVMKLDYCDLNYQTMKYEENFGLGAGVGIGVASNSTFLVGQEILSFKSHKAFARKCGIVASSGKLAV